MERIGTDMAPAEFIEAVSIAFQDTNTHDDAITERFKSEDSFLQFQEALRRVRDASEQTCSVLVLGCGRGLAGLPASFATSVVREVFPHLNVQCVREFDIQPVMLRNGNHEETTAALGAYEFDLVVAHSLLHFIPNPATVFSIVKHVLKPYGAFVLSHEPNARFWQNDACQRYLIRLDRQRQMRRMLRRFHPKNLLITRQTAASKKPTRLMKLNTILQERHNWAGGLSDEEMRRIVDIHRPTCGKSNFKIGLDGFDVEALQSKYLSGFQLFWIASSGHLGYNEASRLSPTWRKAEQHLREAFPLDGSVFTSVWKRV